MAQAAPLYLHTSPEFACKKLLAAGEQRIACFAHVYRNRERGPLHHPEFTMLEWYRAGETYEALMRDCGDILALAAETAGTPRLDLSRRRSAIPFAEPERITRRRGLRALRRHRSAGVHRRAMARRIVSAWRPSCGRAGMRVAEDDTWADLFSRVIVEKVEPNLGFGRATILYEYPVAEAALARPTPHDPRVAERFELYACGVELANAFGELTRRRRAAPPLRHGDGGEERASTARPIRWTRISSRRLQSCRKRAASRSASTGW